MHSGAGLANPGGEVKDRAPLILRKERGKSPDSASLMLEQTVRRLNRGDGWRCGRRDPLVNETEEVPCSIHFTFSPASGGDDAAAHSIF